MFLIQNLMVCSDGVSEACRFRELIRLAMNFTTTLCTISFAVRANWTISIFREMSQKIMNVTRARNKAIFAATAATSLAVGVQQAKVVAARTLESSPLLLSFPLR